MNNISFSGINNLYIGKKTDTRIGAYVNNKGEFQRGEKNYITTKFRCNLTDDFQGNDLTEFRDALSKCKNSYQANCVAKTNLNDLELIINRFDVKDKTGAVSNSEFKLNGIAIAANDRKVLPLFSYLAKLTKKMQNLPDTTSAQSEYLKLANKSIHEEAMRFIDNM